MTPLNILYRCTNRDCTCLADLDSLDNQCCPLCGGATRAENHVRPAKRSINRQSLARSLVICARNILEDDEDFENISVADRAADGVGLAEAVLRYFGEAT